MKKSNFLFLIFSTLVLGLFLLTDWFTEIEYKFYDFKSKFVQTTASDSIIIISMNSSDIQQLNSGEISQEVLALLIRSLQKIEPRKIILDFYYYPFTFKPNQLLEYTLSKNQSPILSGIHQSFLNSNMQLPLGQYIDYKYSNIITAEDDKVREIPTTKDNLQSLPLSIKPNQIQSKKILLISPYLQLTDYKVFSVTQFLNTINKSVNIQGLKNKYIFIGYNVIGKTPYFQVPKTDIKLSGLNLQVNFFNSIINRQFTQKIEKFWDILINLLLMIGCGFIAVLFDRRKALIIVVGILAINFGINIWCFTSLHIQISFLYPTFAALLNFAIIALIKSYRYEIYLRNEIIKDKEIIQSILNNLEGYAILFEDEKILYTNKQVTELENIFIQNLFNTKMRELNQSQKAFTWWEEEIEEKIYRFSLTKLDKLKNFTGHSLYLLLSYNITEHIELRKEIEEKEHLASIGQMAAGIAHEIRNPLAGIELSALSIQEKLQKDSHVAGNIDNMVLAIKGLNRFITEFLDFSKNINIIKRPSDLISAIHETLMMCNMNGKNITINTVGLPEKLILDIDPDRIKQVLTNLLSNSINAIEQTGEITIQAMKENNQSIIKIIDNGIGISQENISKIFDPFFTTRPEGTGLGLAISKRIMQAHSAKIAIQSQNQKGTIVKLIFSRQGEKIE